MSSSIVQWDRLVRYLVTEKDEARYGEPVLANPDKDDIAGLAKNGKLQVRFCEGSNALNTTPTNRTETVKTLLGPLEPRDVPIIRCVGLNYKSHILEGGKQLPTCSTVFTKPSLAVADHGEGVPIPRLAQEQCDYEGELVIVIGREGKNVRGEDALEYIAEYTAGNDVSARDWQRETEKAGPVPQWTFSKSFDKYAPLGPCIVAAHILGEADNLSLRTLVKGEVRQEINTSDLCFGVKKLVEFCSQGQTLEKGSLIMTGTPGGVGLFMKPPNFLKHMDEVNVEIGKIGRVSNRMIFE